MQATMEMRARSALFVHGAGGGGWEWTIWRRVFAAHGWRCMTPDLQPVAAGLAATRLDDYAAQLSDHARHDGSDVWIGASLGGLLALICAARQTPAALVLVNPLPGAEHAHSLRPPPDAAIVPWGSERNLASTVRALPDADAAARLFAFRRWRDESGAVLRDAHTGVAIARPACPVLVVASECDDDVPLAISRGLAESLGAELRVAADASHVGPLLGRVAASIALETLAWLERNTIAAHRGGPR